MEQFTSLLDGRNEYPIEWISVLMAQILDLYRMEAQQSQQLLKCLDQFFNSEAFPSYLVLPPPPPLLMR